MSEVRRLENMALGDIIGPNEYNFVRMLQDDGPDTIYSLAKFAFYGLKLYMFDVPFNISLPGLCIGMNVYS